MFQVLALWPDDDRSEFVVTVDVFKYWKVLRQTCEVFASLMVRRKILVVVIRCEMEIFVVGFALRFDAWSSYKWYKTLWITIFWEYMTVDFGGYFLTCGRTIFSFSDDSYCEVGGISKLETLIWTHHVSWRHTIYYCVIYICFDERMAERVLLKNCLLHVQS